MRAKKHSSPSPSRAAAPIPAAPIQTRAEKKGDRYILNGTKTWISGVGQSNWGLVFARTGPSKGRDGITAFIVEKKFKGFSYKPIPVIRSYSPYEISFEDCEVPEENRLGEEGEGFKLAETWLVHARVPYAAAVHRHRARRRSRSPSTGRSSATPSAPRSADRQAIQWMIADARSRSAPRGCWCSRPPARADQGLDIKVDASVVQGLRDGDRRQGRRPLHPDLRRARRRQGIAARALVSRTAHQAHRRRPSEVHRMVIARDLLGGQRPRSVAHE